MSWETLSAIREEAAEYDRIEQTKRPVACPNDHTPLKDGPGGSLFCPFDGWRYPADA